jgi:hypothetical protein
MAGEGMWKDAGEQAAWVGKSSALEEMAKFCSSWNHTTKVMRCPIADVLPYC